MLDWKKYSNYKKFLIYLLFTSLIYFYISFALFPNDIQSLKEEQNSISSVVATFAKLQAKDIDTIQVFNSNITLNDFNIPFKNDSLNNIQVTELVPLGMTVGIKINTDGVMVLGTGYVNDESGNLHKPSEEILKPGDLLLTANGEKLINKDSLINIIENCDNDILMTLNRDGEVLKVNITPIKDTDNINKIGIWVRDSTQGIGTITYYNPLTGKFGALGHGIVDVDTKDLMSVRDGELMKSEISSIKKGKKGSPGELVGDIEAHNVIGQVQLNSNYGIYGFLNENRLVNESNTMNAIPIALQKEVHEGPATILSNVEGSDVKEYDVYIESVNKHDTDNSKGMVMRITDTELLSKTNGIVQGMSGSPIIQDNKLVGAVTHVFVQDPTKGYGIFIENMIKQEYSI